MEGKGCWFWLQAPQKQAGITEKVHHHVSGTPYLQKADVLLARLLALVVHLGDQLHMPAVGLRRDDVALLRHQNEEGQRQVPACRVQGSGFRVQSRCCCESYWQAAAPHLCGFDPCCSAASNRRLLRVHALLLRSRSSLVRTMARSHSAAPPERPSSCRMRGGRGLREGWGVYGEGGRTAGKGLQLHGGWGGGVLTGGGYMGGGSHSAAPTDGPSSCMGGWGGVRDRGAVGPHPSLALPHFATTPLALPALPPHPKNCL